MKKLVLPILMLVMTSAIAQQKPSVNVNGVGEVVVVPDEVTVTLSVENEAKTAEAAKKENDAVVDDVLDLTKKLGIKQNDVQSQYVRLYKSVDYKTKVATYRATQTIAVKLRDLKKYDAVMSQLLESGVNGIQGVSFSSSKQDEYESQARKKAIADAKKKAEEYVSALGQNIGPAIQITENGASAPQPMPVMRMSKMMESDVQETLAPGEMTITSTVSVSFVLLD